jgi:hypothetical protein
MTVNNFIAHYNLVKWIRGDRNAFNASYRTVLYRIVSGLIWFILIPIKILDAIGFFYLFDVLRRSLVKTRKMTSWEVDEARKVFGDSINWRQVRIREHSGMARLGAKSAKKKHIGFVLFRTINFSRDLDHENTSSDMPWLIHELVHVLQFRHLGAQYIIEALRAQQTAGYSYKGVDGLRKAKHLEQFNLEQQADIAKHYYQALRNDQNIRLYKPFIEEMKQGKF